MNKTASLSHFLILLIFSKVLPFQYNSLLFIRSNQENEVEDWMSSVALEGAVRWGNVRSSPVIPAALFESYCFYFPKKYLKNTPSV